MKKTVISIIVLGIVIILSFVIYWLDRKNYVFADFEDDDFLEDFDEGEDFE